MRQGLIHIYCGDGKGKTTTGMGLCARAAGYGLKVLIYQFMKDNSTSERSLLDTSPNITFLEGLEQEKFSFQMNANEKEQRKAYYQQRFADAIKIILQEHYDVLFLDEIIYTISAGLFEEELLIDFLRHKPEHLEVILTGQNPSQTLIGLADYVSEIRKIKHPYDQNIASRPGIEK